MHRHRTAHYQREPGSQARQHQLCGAADPYYANGDAAVHQTDERVSKKVENHIAAVSLHFQALQLRPRSPDAQGNPAMADGVSDRLREIGDIVRLLEDREASLLAEEREEKLARVYRHVLPSNYE